MIEHQMVAPTSTDLRKFGLTVGGAFFLLGLASRWRGHATAPIVLWILGALLISPALVVPAVLRPIQRYWMGAAAVLGNINTRIILSAFFYAVLTPIGFVLRLFRDPLDRAWDNAEPSYWVHRKPQPVDPASYDRQF